MKKVLQIFILGFYLLACTGLQELTRLPVLFQHYFEHKDLDNNISFLTYLDQHYNDVPHTDDDEERDRQLPFKTNDVSVNGPVGLALPLSFGEGSLKLYKIFIDKKTLIDNDHIPNSTFAGKIWQPPKVIVS